MNFGIKQKVLFVLVGVLALTTALNALLASYYTNRQNQESAFTSLDRDLLAWQDDLQALTLRLRDAALSASNDSVLLNELGELITLELTADDMQKKNKDTEELARILSYKKTVPLSRLHLVLRISGFSSIATYIGGKLSHYVSTTEAGMTIRRGNTPPVWVMAAADAKKNLDFQSWPAWQEGARPPTVGPTIAEVRQPTVSVTFPTSEFAFIEIAIPLQGVIEEMPNDYPSALAYRLVSDLTFTDTEQVRNQATQASHRRRSILAVLVFRKRIDRADLQEIATRTGKWPAFYSLDGKHQLLLTNANWASEGLLQKVQTIQTGMQPRFIRQTVTTKQGSFYETLRPWQFENQPRLILGLMSSRDSTLQNIWQTVTAILIVAGLILVLSMGVGTFWVGRFIDPIVALTNAVKRIGIQHRRQSEQPGDNRIAAELLHPIVIEAPDEIGELSAAFNVMIAELRRSIETLEQRVQDRTAELRQQTRYLRTLIDTLPLWVWLKDTQRRYLITNQASADACGYTVEEIIGKSDQELWPPELAQRYLADDLEVMTSRQRKTVEEPIESVGGVIWMETHRAPVLDEDGTVLGTVGAATNISERKAAEEAREKSLAEAMRLARKRSEFLAQMSHELRTPLNAILGYVQILRRDTQHLTQRQVAGLVTIQESGQHLLTLINDILDLARAEAGKLVLSPSDVDLSIFVRVLGDIIRVKAEEKSLLFTYEAAPDLPAAVRVDDKRLRQILLNLLGNAVKFTDRGEVILRVQRMPSPGPGKDGEAMARLRFEVQDSGIGMSEEQISRLFHPFEQVGEANRRESGTGLGLAISQQLIHLMGGQIQVKSQLNKGSLFWFELDLPVSKADIALLPVQPQVIGYEGSRKKVLVVDDVAQNRGMLIDALLPLGFKVFDADNGQECLDQLDSIKPDLIVMDVMMPVLNGWDATRRIRSMPVFSGIPIIIVTASATSEDQAKAYEAGANAFIPKPIEHQVLLKIIGEQLSLKWIYEKPVQEPAAVQAEKTEEFIIPPRDEIDELYRLARMGNMQDIHKYADRLQNLDSRYTPFAAKLRDLADSYQSKAIGALVEMYRTGLEEARAANSSV